MTEIVILVVSLGIIWVASVRIVQANRIFARSNEEIRLLAMQPVELAQTRKELERTLSNTIDQLGRSKLHIEQQKGEQIQLKEELAKLRARTKDKLYTMDRMMPPGQTMWEVLVSNDQYFNDVPNEEFRMSWVQGRRYLVAASSERDARRRAELRFISSQGYKIIQVGRSARF